MGRKACIFVWLVLSWQRFFHAAFACLALLRLVPALFPASDVWHPVVTPSLLIATASLASAHQRHATDVAQALLLCAVLVEYVRDSKRYTVCLFRSNTESLH